MLFSSEEVESRRRIGRTDLRARGAIRVGGRGGQEEEEE